MSQPHFDVTRLEQLLAQWGDLASRYHILLLAQLRSQGLPFINKEAEAIMRLLPEFRAHLLTAASNTFNLKRFGCATRITDGTPLPGMVDEVAHVMFKWCALSRNVFHIDDDLHLLLQATSFATATWGSIPWPFDSFMLELDRPIELRPGFSVDSIMFAKHNDGDKQGVRYTFLLLPAELGTHPCMPENKKQRVLLEMKRGNIEKALALYDAHDQRMGEARVLPLIMYMNEKDMLERGLNAPLDSTYIGDSQDPRIYTNSEEVVKLVAAFALYLTTLPPQQTDSSSLRTKNLIQA